MLISCWRRNRPGGAVWSRPIGQRQWKSPLL